MDVVGLLLVILLVVAVGGLIIATTISAERDLACTHLGFDLFDDGYCIYDQDDGTRLQVEYKNAFDYVLPGQ